VNKQRSCPHANSPTLDRIQNDQGYIPGNVIVVCSKANRIKNNGCLVDLILTMLWLYWTMRRESGLEGNLFPTM